MIEVAMAVVGIIAAKTGPVVLVGVAAAIRVATVVSGLVGVLAAKITDVVAVINAEVVEVVVIMTVVGEVAVEEASVVVRL